MSEVSKMIIFYGTEWCSDCRRTFFFLKRKNIPIEYINIDENVAGENFVITLNHGNRSVPTIIFPDGSYLVEPSNQEIAEKLNLG
jgi:glutaredoxin